MATTYTQLQTRIAEEFARTDLTATRIPEAVISAIRHYQRLYSLFNQDTDTISTAAGTAEYALDADFLGFDRVEITVDGNTYPLTLEDYDRLKSDDVSGHRGEPYRYAYRNAKIRLYPVPDAVYTVTVYQWIKAAEPAAGSDDTTAWTNDFIDVIRHRAKWDIAAHYLRDDALAGVSKQAEMDTLDACITQRDRLLMAGGARPTCY